MNKIKIRCWKEMAGCAGEDQQLVYFTIPDFGDAYRLYICPKCGALFAVHPETEHYSKRNFEKEKRDMKCPECKNGLSDILPYPENYRNERTGEIEHFERMSRTILPDEQSIVLEVWDPFS
jgi:DNA-directed RNA polymerase subunit RPC12/RpoP